MNLALFYVWEDARVWAHWNHSFAMHLSSLGPVSCVFASWVPSGCTVGGGCRGWWLDGRHPVSILSSLRAHCQGSCHVTAWWLQHRLFTDTAGNTFSLTHSTKSKWLERMKFMEQHNGKGIEINGKLGDLVSIPNTSIHWVYTDVTFLLSTMTCEMTYLDHIRDHKLAANWQGLACRHVFFGLHSTLKKTKTNKQTNPKNNIVRFLKARDVQANFTFPASTKKSEDWVTYICIPHGHSC